jgi:hypothetical protein
MNVEEAVVNVVGVNDKEVIDVVGVNVAVVNASGKAIIS